MPKLKILHTIPCLGRKSFGIGPVALNLVRHQQSQGMEAKIWCSDDCSDLEPILKADLQSDTIRTFSCMVPERLSFSPEMLKAISGFDAGRYDILHQHEIWTALSHASNKWRARYRQPTVITVHGALDAWAVNKSKWGKKLALAAYESKNLRNASCFHALSESEAISIRNFGLTNPIAVIPNGIDELWIKSAGCEESFRRKYAIRDDLRLILFLGRVTPKKGLPMLIEAMSQLGTKLNNWMLIVAGADEFNHASEIRSLVGKYALDNNVRVIGPIYNEDKRNAFAAADVFVLPSHSEGAPMVILEALGTGRPVLATKASPWEDLVTNGCGWWTDINATAISSALNEATNKTKSALMSMGEKGRKIVYDGYTWTRIASMSVELYQWLLELRDKPNFVQTID
jgi:glycosyltransferase involved in cell wall biosynthesis